MLYFDYRKENPTEFLNIKRMKIAQKYFSLTTEFKDSGMESRNVSINLFASYFAHLI
jgi:hypothetical protein